MHFPGQFNNGLRLQSRDQRYVRIDALEQGACRFGVLANPMRQTRRHFHGVARQHPFQRHLRVAMEVQRRWHQVELA